MKLYGLLALSLVLILSGCAHKPSVVGKWKMQAPAGTPQPTGAAAGMMDKLTAMLSFEFKSDNTFSGPMGISCTYTMDGNTVVMNATKMGATDIPKTSANRAEKAELSEDGKTLTMHAKKGAGGSGGQQDMVFVPDEPAK
jgi:hypothetical protein